MSLEKRLTRRGFLGRTLAAAAAGLAVPGRIAAVAARTLPYLQDQGWQVGCWTRPWASEDYRVGMDAAAEAGFKYLALTGAKTSTGRVIAPGTTLEESRQVGEEARSRDLTITNVYGGGLRLEEGGAALIRMVDNCAAAGARSVLLSQVGPEESFQQCCQTIAECCDYASEKEIVVVLKPHGGTTGTGPQLRRAFEVMISPGSGIIDFPKLMARLQQGGFKYGPLMIETLVPGNLEQTLAEAKKARRFVEQLVAG